jgi:predicted TPR repeat methyltransferase
MGRYRPYVPSRRDALDRLEAWSQPARRRLAAAIFLGGRARSIDRLVAGIYFAAAVGRWERWAAEPAHTASLRAALAVCRPPTLSIDIGTGTGCSAAVIADAFPNATVTGVDRSRAMLRRAERNPHLDHLTFRIGTASRLPVADGSVDLVACLNAVPDPVELRRVLAPGAQTVVASSTLALADRGEVWADRWRMMHFRRVDAGDVGAGSWELFEWAGE